MNSDMPGYNVTSYDGQKIAKRQLCWAEARTIATGMHDHYLAICWAVFAFLTADGALIEPKGKWPQLGRIGLEIIEAIQNHSGIYLDPNGLALITGNEHLLDPNNWNTSIHRLRRAHHESPRSPNFFLTRKSGGPGLAWAQNKTWIRIKPIIGRQRGIGDATE